MTSNALPLAVTMGDPSGIGLEVLFAAWRGRRDNPLPSLYLLADPAHCKAVAAPDDLPIRPLSNAVHAVAGKPDPANAPAIVESIDRAVADVLAGQASGMVTLPIAKSRFTRRALSTPATPNIWPCWPNGTQVSPSCR